MGVCVGRSAAGEAEGWVDGLLDRSELLVLQTVLCVCQGRLVRGNVLLKLL